MDLLPLILGKTLKVDLSSNQPVFIVRIVLFKTSACVIGETECPEESWTAFFHTGSTSFRFSFLI